MDPTDVGLFQLAERRLAWADARQRLLAQNVANANTPGWQTRDLTPFGSALGNVAMTQTSGAHLQSPISMQHERTERPRARSPDQNTVSIEDMLSRVADTAAMQELTLNIHKRYASMFRLAYGRQG